MYTEREKVGGEREKKRDDYIEWKRNKTMDNRPDNVADKDQLKHTHPRTHTYIHTYIHI